MHASRIVCEVLHAVWHTQEGSLGPPVEGKMHSFYICNIYLRFNITSDYSKPFYSSKQRFQIA